MNARDDDPILKPVIEPEGTLTVRIMDLSGGNGSDPVEIIRGFGTVEHANTFARRYVRDSVERFCSRPILLRAHARIDLWRRRRL